VGTYTGFSTTPSISGNNVAYIGNYNSVSGVFRGSGGTPTTIAKAGDAAPTSTFSAFNGIASISGSTVAFRALYNSNADQGIFTGTGGALTVISKKGDAGPSGTFITYNNPGISGSTVAISAQYSQSPALAGYFTGSGGALTT